MRTLRKNPMMALVSALMLASAATSYGDIIAMHSGSADPRTEPGLGVAFGNGDLGTPVSLDLGTTAAWAVNDADTMIAHTFTAAEQTAIDANGYSMSANVRLTAPNATIGQNVLYVRANDQRFVVWFTTDSNAIPTVRVHPQASRTYSLDTAGYHEYKLLVDADGLADLYVDNVERIPNISYDPDEGNDYAGFGGSSANWNSFQLTVVPEPSSLALSAAGLLGLLAYAWRRRKS